jgi:DNA-binding winged helix-turn-helix (wHTH) protein
VGQCTVLPELNTLERDGSTVHLEPKVMQVLVALSEQPGEVVSKEQIFKRVWPDTFVSDEVLTRSISELRKAFEDNPQHPKYIQTIPKGGYRLVATVVREPANRKDWYAERWRMLMAATAVLLLTAVASFYTLKTRKLGASKPVITSLAVLPLANLSGGSCLPDVRRTNRGAGARSDPASLYRYSNLIAHQICGSFLQIDPEPVAIAVVDVYQALGWATEEQKTSQRLS